MTSSLFTSLCLYYVVQLSNKPSASCQHAACTCPVSWQVTCCLFSDVVLLAYTSQLFQKQIDMVCLGVDSIHFKRMIIVKIDSNLICSSFLSFFGLTRLYVNLGSFE